jgi:hypothetical protein
MKKAIAQNAAKRSFNSRRNLVAIVAPIVLLFAAVFSGGVSAHERQMFAAPPLTAPRTAARELIFAPAESISPFTSSLITQIDFNPVNQPANFTAGVPNPSTQPLRIQTLRADGTGENVTGAGVFVFIEVSSSSPTGRFDLSPTGAFSGSTITLTVGSGRQNTQDFYYRDTTPGQVFLLGVVTNVGNTGLAFGESAAVIKTVVPAGGGRLSFEVQPASANKDASISPAVKVRVEDSAGNLDTTSSRNVSLAIASNPASGTLSGTTTVAAVNGIATFNNLSINKAGNGYTLTASSSLPAPALTASTSLPFNVNKLDQVIVFDEIDDKTYGDDDFDVHATSTFGTSVSFASRTADTCAVSSGSVHIVSAGVCTIRASLAGDADHNDASNVDRSFNINKADAAVVVEPYDVVYDGGPHEAILVSITGVNGESDAEVGTVDLTGTLHTNAGSYGSDAWNFIGNENYNDTSGSVSNTIAKASATAHAGGGSATYDGSQKTPSSCSISGPGYLGDLTCSNDPVSVGPKANSYSIGPNVSGTALSNFDIAKVNGSFTIKKAPTVVAVSFENGPYVYRGSAFNASARVTGVNGLDQSMPVIYSGDCLNVTALNGCVAAAEYPESENYIGNAGSARITIAKRALNVTASRHVLTFGDPVPNVTPSFDGFAADEKASVIDEAPTCAGSYAVGSPVGVYLTNCSGGLDNNYAFANYTSGSISVNTACSSFNGFGQPIGGANAFPNPSGAGGSFNSPLRIFKLNSTVPFKFTAVCYGVPLTSGVQSLSAQKYTNGVPVGEEIESFGDDNSEQDNLFRYSDGQWHFNFKTKHLGDGAQGTWLFEVTLFDGSKFSAWLAIRK